MAGAMGEEGTPKLQGVIRPCLPLRHADKRSSVLRNTVHSACLTPSASAKHPPLCLQSLRGPGQTAEALLLKHARATQQRPTDPVTYGMR